MSELSPPGPATDVSWQPSERELERRATRQRMRRGRLGVAAVATVVLLGALVAGAVLSPGWDRFAGTFLDPEHAREVFPLVRDAFWTNVKMFLLAEVCILVVGALVALTRVSTSPWLTPLRLLAVVYTDVFRGLPTLLVVFVCAFGIPALELEGVTTDLFTLATFALVLSYGAYVAEVFRAGITSIHPSQVASAEALGLGRGQTMRKVVLPQAVRRVLPPLLNDFISLQKDTALVASVGVVEALRAASNYGNYHFNYTGLTVAACFFVVLTIPLARLTDWLSRRAERRERGLR